MATFALVQGGTLRNGATVIEFKKSSLYGNGHHTALCRWGFQFVTWRVDENGNAYLGHYHGDNEDAARRDFCER